ncbi:MAG: beta-galactosidase [Candidatus Sumerlaeota bacterium]|nr:beta-galactosidase [Candidatus Sumerlaeota bacterium]
MSAANLLRNLAQICLIVCVLLIVSAANRCPAADAPLNANDKAVSSAGALVEITLPLLPETVPGQEADPARTVVVATWTAEGHAQSLALVPSADTMLWKDSDKPNGAGGGIALRDNRWSQGLLKLSLDGLPKDKPVEKAVFRFKAGGSERPGNAKLQFHRMLVDWSEDAGWHKPFPDKPQVWDGLRPGKDYEAEPFATWEVEQWKSGGMVEIPGFEKAVNAWRDGSAPNYGFVALFWGKSLQIGIPSREAKPAAKPARFALGGPKDEKAILRINAALLRRALAKPDDLERAALELKIKVSAADAASVASASLSFFCAKPARAAAAAGAEPEFEDSPLANCPLGAVGKDGVLAVAGLEKLLRQTDAREEIPLQVGVGGTKKPVVQVLGAAAATADRPRLKVSLKAYPRQPLFDFNLRPTPGVYCVAKDGHLFYGDRRLRLWGEVGYGAADRKRKMGFNCDRLWNGPDFYDDASVKRGETIPAAQLAGKPVDKFDAQFAAIKAQSMFVMYAGLTSSIPLDKYRKSLLADDSFIAGGEDWAQWKEAAAGKLEQNRLTIIDERLQKLRLAHAKNLLTHINPLTNKRLGQDEAIVIYEVWNELGFVRWALEGGFDKVPPYFQEKARRKWNAWLKEHYHNDAALQTAWGRLAEGESLEAGSIKLGPTLEKRGEFPEQRGRDFVRFNIELLNAFNQRFREYCRALAPKGIGVNVAPFSFDTQYRPSVPWAYTNAQGDVNCFGMYFWGIQEELAKPPSMYVIDSHSVAGKPTVLYETNQSRPSPYRSDYPIRIAALASWEDWDGVIFHYWGGLTEEGTPDEQYLIEPLLHVNRSHYWTGVHHATDPVMCSAMAIAGRMFLGGALHPASDPLFYEVGAKAIFGYDAVNGIGMAQAAFSRGAHLKFAPKKQTGVTVGGEAPPPSERLSGAVIAGDQITWDWPNGRLIIDAPTCKAYIGRTSGAWRFKDGIALSGVSTPWVCFVLVSADGKPLAGADASREMRIAATFDAKNTGFQMDPNFKGGGPFETADAIRNTGHAPVIVDPVGYTLSFPTEIEARFEGYDFALRKVAEQTLRQTNGLVREPRELYMGVLRIEKRGQPAETPPSSKEIASVSVGVSSVSAQNIPALTTTAAADAAGPWNPVPGLSWNANYRDAHKFLRESPFVFTTISKPDNAGATISLSDAQILWGAPADMVFAFENDRLARIEATFKRPPALTEAIADYEKRFGPPIEKKIVRQEKVSRIVWRAVSAGQTLEIILTETQGTMSLTYQLRRKA